MGYVHYLSLKRKLLFCICLMIILSGCISSSIPQTNEIDNIVNPSDWQVDFKTSRINAQTDEGGKTFIDFVGTISNYGSSNFDQ